MDFDCPPELELMSDIVYGPTPTRAHLLDVLRPRSSASRPVPAILFLHGGGWQMFGKYPEINVFLAQAGFVTASSNYRYSSEATFPAQLEDARAAIDWLRTNADALGIDPGYMGAWGISAGGHLAAFLGVLNEVQAVVDVCGPVDLLDPAYPLELEDANGVINRLLGVRAVDDPERAQQASPVYHVSNTSAPTLMVHGVHDTHVPLSQSERLHQALQAAGVSSRLKVIQDGDHFINETHAHYLEQLVLGFFQLTLGNPAKEQASVTVF